MKVLVIGHSHLFALKSACKSGIIKSSQVDFVYLKDERYLPLVNKGVINANLREKVESFFTGENDGLILTCLGGNIHNVIGLVNHPVPYNFVTAEDDEMDLSSDEYFIPTDMLRTYLVKKIRQQICSKLKVMSESFDIPIAQLETPPPLPNDSSIASRQGGFGEGIASMGIAPAVFRLKLWELYSDSVQSECRTAGVGYCSLPVSVKDASGFLVEQAWGKDPTHGNSWYGGQILESVLASSEGTK